MNLDPQFEIVKKSYYIWTWTESLTLAYLALLASKARNAVEFGVYLGRSSKVMLDASPALHLWAVDAALVAGVFETAAYFLRNEIRDGRCEMIRGDSSKAGQMLVHMRGHIDLIFVDDGHSEEDLVRDITVGLELLSPGGIMVGHDWEGDNDVSRGVKKTGIPITVPVPRLWQYAKP